MEKEEKEGGRMICINQIPFSLIRMSPKYHDLKGPKFKSSETDTPLGKLGHQTQGPTSGGESSP